MQGYNEANPAVQAVRQSQQDRIAFWRSHGPELPTEQGAETMTDNAQDIAGHVYTTPEVHELPLFAIGDPLDYLSAAQHRDLRAIQAESYVSGSDDFADGLTVDYGRVI